MKDRNFWQQILTKINNMDKENHKSKEAIPIGFNFLGGRAGGSSCGNPMIRSSRGVSATVLSIQSGKQT